ncbi:MAG TPA: aspartate/glutamate racemase family protein [Verrucomicrobiae bacterium]|nr:aspartate/glutamate racemase family protein [Verrucomicrobiae bacterium]
MKTKTLALIHTVSWYHKSVNAPFVEPWLKKNPDVRVFNIMDDSLLCESLAHRKATNKVLKRIQFYALAAEAMGADVAMCSCTTVGEATRIARQYTSIPVFNIDEPMAREAVRKGRRLGIIATVPTSPAATKRQLEYAAADAGVKIDVKIAVNQKAFAHLQKGEIEKHNELVHQEMDKLAPKVDVLVLGQISLAQIKHKTRVTVLQVGHSGLAEARRLLNQVRN